MPTPSFSYNLSTNRDGIITRALRIIGALGQGETPSSTAVTEAAEALNDLVKEWQTEGMPLWCLKTYGPFTLTASDGTYTIGTSGMDWNNSSYGAPLKVHQMWLRNNSLDTPIDLITRDEYYLQSAKTSTGSPIMCWYDPPGAGDNSSINIGTFTFYPYPNATSATSDTIYFVGQRGFSDFDASTDVPDFPQHWFNALKWGLADQLSYEYGIPMAQKAQLAKKAQMHKEAALSFSSEEGSLFITPTVNW